MTYNPFIWLWQHPVLFFGAVGYLSLMVGILYAAGGKALQNVMEVYQDWLLNRDRDKWPRLFGDGWGYIPTGENAVKLFIACLTASAGSFAVSALVWFVSGGA